jgi:hypothetical protein
MEVSLSDEEHKSTIIDGISAKPSGPRPERFLLIVKDNYLDSEIGNDISSYHRHPLDVARRIIQDLGKQILYIPPLRVVGYNFEAEDMRTRGERSDSGSNLLSDFLSWFLPAADTGKPQPEKAMKFQDLAKKMLGAETVMAWPTPDQKIRVKINNEKPRDLDQMGSGISQVFAIASTIASRQSPIVLMEEPEIGLHPRLQRQVMNVLSELPEGQVFVTSHSNHVIDTVNSRVNSYLLRESRRIGHSSPVVEELKPSSRAALEELGIRPSSIALANSLILVEGPSDALYVRHWLSLHDEGRTLNEYKDYAFIFTGGKILSHFSSGDDENAIVQLFAVHPNFYLIGDSDRSGQGASVQNRALKRICEEAGLGNRAWVTHPKEIEGYISDADVMAAHPTASPSSADDVYLPLEERLKCLGVHERYTKVSFATKIVAFATSLDRFDLRTQMERLVAFILKCQDAPTDVKTPPGR